MPFQGKLLGGRSGNLLYQQEQVSKQLQKMADDYKSVVGYYIGPNQPITPAQLAARERSAELERDLMYGARVVTPRLTIPVSPYDDLRHRWPFEREDTAWQAKVRRGIDYFFIAAAALLLWGMMPAFWWVVRAWGWAFR